MRNSYNTLEGKPEARSQLGEFDLHWRIILRWIVNKKYVSTWTGFICLRTGFCEYGNESSRCERLRIS
jgi:hypothetical protein